MLAKKIYQNFFLLYFLAISLTTNHFTNCESYSSDNVTIACSRVSNDSSSKKRSFMQLTLGMPWKQVAFRYLFLFGSTAIIYNLGLGLEEWLANRSFSDREKTLLWDKSVLSILVAIYCMAPISSSQVDANIKNNQETQIDS